MGAVVKLFMPLMPILLAGCANQRPLTYEEQMQRSAIVQQYMNQTNENMRASTDHMNKMQQMYMQNLNRPTVNCYSTPMGYGVNTTCR
jgi:hypothetical protein